MNESTSTSLNDLYANIVQAALFTLSEQTVIRPLVRNYNMVGTPGLVAQVPKYAAIACLLYTSPSPRDKRQSRMPSSA